MKKPVVFVTGASRGIGLALVKRFKKAGYGVAACSRSPLQVAEVDLPLVCDVADATQVKNSIAAILQHFGRLDVVVNNAGLAGSNSLDPEDNDDFWHQVMGTNLHGTYYVCKHALPHLPEIGRAHV